MQQKMFDLNTLDGINGFTVPGIAGSRLGYAVGTAGDINGDGISDLVLGADLANSNAGASYVIFGNRGGFGPIFNLTTLNGANGFTVPGVIVASGQLGQSVSTAGDINGDGISDLVLGASNINSQTGASYVIFGTRGGFNSVFNLTNLNGNNGFTVPGVVASGKLGQSVSTAGDINGDGISDLILGANGINSNAGASYVIFGTRGGFNATFNLTNLNGTNGFAILGVVASGQLGRSVSTAGDVNGDGISDLILGAVGISSNAGASYVIFGTRGGFNATFNLTNLNGTNGFIVPSVTTGGWLGSSTSTAGDINGDGISELILGANLANSNTGTSYVIFGTRGGFNATFNLTNLNGTNGFTVPGVTPGGQLGRSINTVGDINGDGVSDLVLGAYQANSLAGASYVIFGSRGAFGSIFNLTNLNGADGFTVPGIAAFGGLGSSTSTAGDINGDGMSDLVLGAFNVNSGGASYVIFGNPLLWINNQMTITQGQSLLLTNTQLNVKDFSNSTANLGFTVSNVQGGRFEIVSNPGIYVATFTQQQITNNQIRFVSDRTAVVSYAVSATNGKFTLPPLLANVNFTNPIPILINTLPSQFVPPNQPFHFTFPANQTFTDADGDPLTYSAKLSNGSSLPNWINFNTIPPNQLDFTGTAPSLSTTQIMVAARDPLNATANTSFSLVAKSIWVNNQMTITQGQSLLLSNNELDATGLNDPAANITFTVSNVQGGRFELVSNQSVSVATFTQQQINSNQLRFVSDRTAPVSYQVSVTDGRFSLPPLPATVNFTNHAPEILSTPATQLIEPNKPFQFSLQANQIFNDTDGDPLSYSATLSGGSPLPNWVRFDTNQPNQLAFSGLAPATEGGTRVSLLAQDPLNVTAKTEFEILSQVRNGTDSVVNTNEVNPALVAGGVIGGVLGLGALIGAGFGFWRYSTNKTTRHSEQFADLVRSALNLKDVDNFDSETGQKFVGFVHQLQRALQQAGIDVTNMRPVELGILASDVATAARNKITPATNCLRQSVITVTDLNDNLEALVSEVQILRNAGRQSAYTV